MYDDHLPLLAEWNESATFYASTSTVHTTDLGTIVAQDVEVSEPVADPIAAVHALIGWAMDEDHAAPAGWLKDHTGYDADELENAAAGLPKPPHRRTYRIQVVAVYGDDEQLFRLVVFENDHTDPSRRTSVLVNAGPMRS